MIKKVLGLLYLDTMILQAKRDKQQKEDLKPKEMQKFMKAILYLIKQKILVNFTKYTIPIFLKESNSIH